MTAYFWSKAAPGLYFLRDGPRDRVRSEAIGKVCRSMTSGYRISVLVDGMAQPPVSHGVWTPVSAMKALEAHIRQPGDTFKNENF